MFLFETIKYLGKRFIKFTAAHFLELMVTLIRLIPVLLNLISVLFPTCGLYSFSIYSIGVSLILCENVLKSSEYTLDVTTQENSGGSQAYSRLKS